MSTIIREKIVSCDDDCRQEGCPSHNMILSFQTTSNIYCFKQDGETILCIDRSKMRCLLEMLTEMKYRVEVENDLKCVSNKK